MADATHLEYSPASVSAPGETLSAVLAESGMSQAELARRTGLSRKYLSELIHGKTGLSPETALLLEQAIGISAGFWNRREARYRTWRQRQENQLELAGETWLLAQFPVPELERRGWMTRGRGPGARIQNLLAFLGAASPAQLPAIWSGLDGHWRSEAVALPAPGALLAWLRRGEQLAERLSCAPYHPGALKAAIPRLRSLTVAPPQEFVPLITALGQECGVAIVLVPELPGCRTYGVARWLHPHKALVQLSLRRKSDDQFWFSLFHELAHVLLHPRKRIFLEEASMSQDQLELEADRTAGDWLISPQDWRSIRDGGISTLTEIQRAARKFEIAPGIIVGRAQHEGLLSRQHGNHLKRYLEWGPDGIPREKQP